MTVHLLPRTQAHSCHGTVHDVTLIPQAGYPPAPCILKTSPWAHNIMHIPTIQITIISINSVLIVMCWWLDLARNWTEMGTYSKVKSLSAYQLARFILYSIVYSPHPDYRFSTNWLLFPVILIAIMVDYANPAMNMKVLLNPLSPDLIVMLTIHIIRD